MLSQSYFPDEVTDVVYSGEPYSLRRDCGTRNGNDGVFRGDVVEGGVDGGVGCDGGGVRWAARCAPALLGLKASRLRRNVVDASWGCGYSLKERKRSHGFTVRS